MPYQSQKLYARTTLSTEVYGTVLLAWRWQCRKRIAEAEAEFGTEGGGSLFWFSKQSIIFLATCHFSTCNVIPALQIIFVQLYIETTYSGGDFGLKPLQCFCQNNMPIIHFCSVGSCQATVMSLRFMLCHSNSYFCKSWLISQAIV